MKLISSGLPWPTRVPKVRGSWKWHLRLIEEADESLPRRPYPLTEKGEMRFPLIVLGSCDESDAAVEHYSRAKKWPDEVSDGTLAELQVRFCFAQSIFRERLRERQPLETHSELFRWAMNDCWQSAHGAWLEAVNGSSDKHS